LIVSVDHSADDVQSESKTHEFDETGAKTTIRAECHWAQVLERAAQNSRSAVFSLGCFMVRE
jgi:hypothetical protein